MDRGGRLRFRPRFIVLASDGVWEVASNEAVARWIDDYLIARRAAEAEGDVVKIAAGSSPVISPVRCSSRLQAKKDASTIDARARITASEELVVQVLANIASVQRMTVGAVRRLKQGADRRRCHDDITATVVVLDDGQ